jgi:hypothetical protein
MFVHFGVALLVLFLKHPVISIVRVLVARFVVRTLDAA